MTKRDETFKDQCMSGNMEVMDVKEDEDKSRKIINKFKEKYDVSSFSASIY